MGKGEFSSPTVRAAGHQWNNLPTTSWSPRRPGQHCSTTAQWSPPWDTAPGVTQVKLPDERHDPQQLRELPTSFHSLVQTRQQAPVSQLSNFLGQPCLPPHSGTLCEGRETRGGRHSIQSRTGRENSRRVRMESVELSFVGLTRSLPPGERSPRSRKFPPQDDETQTRSHPDSQPKESATDRR